MIFPDLFRRFVFAKTHWGALLLLLVGAACSSSGSSNGGTGNQGGTGGVASISTEDPWVPPEVVEGTCTILNDAGETEETEYLTSLGCRADFDALAVPPLNSSIPGTIATKVILDQADGDKLYFQNSNLYPIHWEFASTHLSVAQGLPDVGALPVFNQTQYSASDRRFLLATVIYFEGPKYWALEFAPADTASTAMMEKLFRAVKDKTFFGNALVIHPASELAETNAAVLPDDIHVKTTNQVFAGIDFVPLNAGEVIADRLLILSAAELPTAYVGFRDVVVLDAIPNDISVVAGIITEQFQTRLSHINVLAVTRGTPNMSLRGATTNEDLKALVGNPVRFTVTAEGYSIQSATQEEADAWWAANAPAAITLPVPDKETSELRDISNVTVETGGVSLTDAISMATQTFGAKSANYSVLSNTPDIPIKPAFAIPVYYYFQFMEENGLIEKVQSMLADAEFQKSLIVQDEQLWKLRNAILTGTVNATFQQTLKDKLNADFPGKKMRFRSSTNAEDLNGFPCAGCYDSHSGDPNVSWTDVLDGIRKTWATIWNYRTFREREYHRIDHLTVGMGLLVHTNFETEEANGVAVTNNVYDLSGLNPAFYVNVQIGGDVEVVHPEAGVTADEFLYYLQGSSQSVQYLSHSNLTVDGANVLTTRQAFDLAVVLDTINNRYNPAYGSLSGNNDWWAMDVEFKFDDEADPSQPPHLYIKQARPYPKPKL